MKNHILFLAKAIENNYPAVLATVVEVDGASPVKPGAQIVILEDGTTAGTVGGGKLEANIIEDARAALEDRTPRLTHYSLRESGEDAIGVLCGGDVRVFLQLFYPKPQLVIVGGGHIGRPLQGMAEIAGFDVKVVDVQPGLGDITELETVTFTSDTNVVLLTTDYVSDEAALRSVLPTPARYIGMIGSHNKCQTVFSNLRQAGYTDEDLERVFAPIGLDLGGSTPHEIAAAIMAEIIAVRRGRSGAVNHRRIRQEKK